MPVIHMRLGLASTTAPASYRHVLPRCTNCCRPRRTTWHTPVRHGSRSQPTAVQRSTLCRDSTSEPPWTCSPWSCLPVARCDSATPEAAEHGWPHAPAVELGARSSSRTDCAARPKPSWPQESVRRRKAASERRAANQLVACVPKLARRLRSRSARADAECRATDSRSSYSGCAHPR